MAYLHRGEYVAEEAGGAMPLCGTRRMWLPAYGSNHMQSKRHGATQSILVFTCVIPEERTPGIR